MFSILSILMSILFVTMCSWHKDWLLRVQEIIFLIAMLAGLGLCGSLSYVRYLDWRRAAATERRAGKA